MANGDWNPKIERGQEVYSRPQPSAEPVDDLKERIADLEKALAIRTKTLREQGRQKHQDRTRIAALEADNARLMGLVKEATDGLAYIKAEATSAVSADGKETDPYALGRCRDQASRTLAKIKETPDA